jgi:starch-binding outer membrane protein, SusD/RagB family
MIKKTIIMKQRIIYALVILLVTLASCSKSFIDRPSLSGATVTNYYNTADQVRAATSTLYSGLAWGGYENRAMDAIADVMSGNEFTWNTDDVPFKLLTVSATSTRLSDSWSAFYKVGGWTSSLISTLEQKKADGGDASFIDPAIAECHFLRGVTYFYIGRIWGNAPIVTDPGAIALTGNFNIPLYYQEDVLRFAREELELAEAGLPETDVAGRVTTYSAKGMLAKLYLYEASLNKSVADYATAKTLAGEVIASGQYDLFNDYAALFNTSENNNNIETLFAIQHQCVDNPWGSGNQLQCDRGPNNLATSESSMWEMYLPSRSLLAAYGNNDLRRAGSVMEQGWKHLSWIPQKAAGSSDNDAYNTFMTNGYVYDTVQDPSRGGEKNGTRSNIAKYVVGPGSSFGGEQVIGMNTGMNTMLLRYADVLLIYAEATLGTDASTTDEAALDAFNKVRTRAGLPSLTSLTLDDILHERRVEFAFEGDYWYDIQRQGFDNAKAVIESQNRGAVGAGNSVYITTFTESMMYLPVPTSESLQDPALLEEPVHYYND